MECLEKLRRWLLSYPDWDAGGLLYIDFADGQPGSAGLYPQGMEEVERVTDVTGTVTARCRWHFALFRMGQRQEDHEKDACWLMDFQLWVQRQSALGLAPVFGDVPVRERIWARKGQQQKANAAGTGCYCVELVAEFVKRYEVK